MQKSMAVSWVNTNELDVHVFLLTARTPSSPEWKQAMDRLRRYAQARGNARRLRILAVSDGAGPNPEMRAEITEFTKRYERIKSAVITVSPIVRGIVTAVSWFNPDIKAFAPKEFLAALQHLGVGQGAASSFVTELRSMAKELPPLSCLSMIDVGSAARSDEPARR